MQGRRAQARKLSQESGVRWGGNGGEEGAAPRGKGGCVEARVPRDETHPPGSRRGCLSETRIWYPGGWETGTCEGRNSGAGVGGRDQLAQYIHEGPSEHPLDTKRHPDCCLVGLTRFGGRPRGALIELLWPACVWRTSGRPKAAIDHAPPSFYCVQIPFGLPLDQNARANFDMLFQYSWNSVFTRTGNDSKLRESSSKYCSDDPGKQDLLEQGIS